MVSELKKLRINELYSTLGYENDYPKRDARLLDAVVHEFFKDFAHHNPISTAQVLNPGADLFAITFLEEEDRGERFWPTTNDNVPAYPRDRALVTNALRQIFIRKKIAVECSKHAKKKLPRDSLTGPPTSSAIKRKKLTILSDGQPPPSKKPRSKLAEPKPWKERPQEPDARGCIEYIRSLNPRRDTTDFTKTWLQTKKASWPEEADLRLQFLMHTHSFYISFDHGDLIPISISQGMKKDTQIEELEAHQIKPFHNRISRRIHELTLKLIKEPPLVLRCQDDGVAVQTQKFSRMWSKKEEYWRVDSTEFQALGHHESSSKKREKKSAKRKEPVVFPKIFLQDEEYPMLGTDNLEAIADSALQFTLAQEDKIAKNNTQHHDGFERHLENPPHSGIVSDERTESLNSDDSILVDARSVPQNSLHTSRRLKSPSSLAMSKEPNASSSGELTLPNTPPATEVKPDTDRVRHNSWLASVNQTPGSSLDSSIVIDDTPSDEEDHPMEDLSIRIPGAFDRVVQNTPANGNVDVMRTSQLPPKKRRILQFDGEIQVSNSHIKDQLAKRSKICRTPGQIPRDTLVDKQRQGAFESDVMGENRITGWAPELRDMLSTAEAQKIGDRRQLEDQVINSVYSEKQSAVIFPVETKYSNEQNGKQNTVEGPIGKAHPKTKAPQIPMTRLLPKTKTPLHTAHKNSSTNGHRVSSSSRRQKLSVASQPSIPTSKRSKLKASVMTPVQAGKFFQQDTASIAETGDSYRKIFDGLDKNSGRSWSESSSGPSDQGEQTLHEREVQPARGELLGNWGRTSDLRLEPELQQTLKEIHSSDLELTSHMVRSKEAKSTFSNGLLDSTSLAAPKERRAMDNQSSVSNMTHFVRDMNELLANDNAVREVDDFIAGAKPSVFQDPAVNESVGQASETFHEVEKDVPRERPVQHPQQAHLQSEIDTLPNDLADTIAHEAPPVREAHLNPSNKVPIISTVTSKGTTATGQTTSCRPNEDSLSPALMPVIEAMENLPHLKPASPGPKKPERNEPAPRETSIESSLLNDEAIKASGPRLLDNSSLVSAATITQLHSTSQAKILESLKQSSRDCQVPVVDSETILPVQGGEPRRNGSYNLVPPAIPFSVNPSPEDSPVKQDTKPVTEPLALSDDRRIAPTPRNASVPTLYLLIRDSKGNLNVEDSYPFDAYVKEYTVPEFFDFFSEVSGIPARSFGTLVFRMNFGENRRIKVQRHSGENVWRKMWKEVHVEFKDAQEEDPKEMEFDVTVSRVN